MSSSMISTSKELPSPTHIKSACADLGRTLGSQKYALVGGAACQVLGSSRITVDIDFVVLKGAVSEARKLLAAATDKFVVEARTLHTHHIGPPRIEIEILSPPGTFREAFGQDTSTIAVDVGGSVVSVLYPVLILNAKCRSILGRSTTAKKNSDGYDIMFLLRYLAEAGMFPSSRDLPNVSKAIVDWFVAEHGREDLWKDAKYDPDTGTFGGTSLTQAP